MREIAERFDLIVVGGGPGGSTLASFVAMNNHKVLLLEQARFPRHQIGESLLPATVHGICQMLGLSEELKQANFPVKLGGTFRWGANPEPWTFAFGDSSRLSNSAAYAYQVERSKFDDILLKNARKKGVDVREEHLVTDVIVENGRVVGVNLTNGEGQHQSARASFVVDASGNQSRISNVVGERIYSKFFQNIALYCYFYDGKRLPSPNSGNILSAAFDKGWFWYIPLSDKLTSVGAVVGREYADKLKDGHESAMHEFINSCPIIKEYLSSAHRVTEGQYGQLRIRKDYSYSNSHFWSPGAVLVGDAACFVDPVFSSGVHLATYSGLLAARSINTCLTVDNEINEEDCFNEFEMRYRREFSHFYQFLIGFYDIHKDKESYFWEARKVLNSEEQSNIAFINLVAGISAEGEPIYSRTEDFLQAQRDIGTKFQQITETAESGTSVNLGTIDGIVEGLTKESGQIQLKARQASLGLANRSRAEKPLFENGLIPSLDGLHWRRPKNG